MQKFGEHINDHQIQNNEAFASNGYVLAVYDMEDLGKTFSNFFDGTDGTRKWENKDPLAIIRVINQFIEQQEKNQND